MDLGCPEFLNSTRLIDHAAHYAAIDKQVLAIDPQFPVARSIPVKLH